MKIKATNIPELIKAINPLIQESESFLYNLPVLCISKDIME